MKWTVFITYFFKLILTLKQQLNINSTACRKRSLSLIRFQTCWDQQPFVLDFTPTIAHSHVFPSSLSLFQMRRIISPVFLQWQLGSSKQTAWSAAACGMRPQQRAPGCPKAVHLSRPRGAQLFGGGDWTCSRGINGGEKQHFLHHRDGRINPNLWTLQHYPANSTNSLFQRSPWHTLAHLWLKSDVAFLWASFH